MQAGDSLCRYDTWACRKPVSLNLGRQMGVQLSADLKLVDASTRFRMTWISAGNKKRVDTYYSAWVEAKQVVV